MPAKCPGITATCLEVRFRLGWLLPRSSRAMASWRSREARDVAEDVADLVPKHQQDHHDHHADQDQNDCVFDHGLPFFTFEQPVKAARQAIKPYMPGHLA